MAVYNQFKLKIMDGTIDMDTNTIKVALCTSGYTPNIDSHTFYSDITSTQVANGNGYTTGGAEITTKTITVNTTSDFAVFDGADVTWSSSTITARYAVIYKSTGTSTTDPLIAYVDFGSDKTSDNGNFVISWSTDGILKLT